MNILTQDMVINIIEIIVPTLTLVFGRHLKAGKTIRGHRRATANLVDSFS